MDPNEEELNSNGTEEINGNEFQPVDDENDIDDVSNRSMGLISG